MLVSVWKTEDDEEEMEEVEWLRRVESTPKKLVWIQCGVTLLANAVALLSVADGTVCIFSFWSIYEKLC